MEKLVVTFSKGIIVSDLSKSAQGLYDKGRYGEIKNKKVYYSMLEAAYLIKLDKMVMQDGRGKEILFNNTLF